MNTQRIFSVLALSLLTAATVNAQPPFGGRGDGGGFRGGGPPGGSFRGGDRGGRSGFDPSSFLNRLDTNGNGVLDPQEQQGPAQFLIGRIQQVDPSVKPGQPIPLKKITEGFEKMRAEREGQSPSTSSRSSSSADQALTVELLVPGFGLEEEPTPLMGFGATAEMLSVVVTEADEREAAERMRRYDRNRDGYLTKDELSSRFAGNPMDFDRNRDGKLSQSELAVRYARRREGEEAAKANR
ncbi:MAG: EF-hand domain-containing protein, partial [Pirellulales bacterium]|nr:EF-hand domain-containing protein [Pirellulales bacterium]